MIIPLLLFMVEAMLISLSGVMAPGPLSAVTVGKGNESPHAGAWVAVGHSVVEVPLMIAVGCGVGTLFNQAYVKIGISLLGGLVLLLMGIDMFLSLGQVQNTSKQHTQSPIMAGILLSLGSPYLFIWWATVGAALIMRSLTFGIFGFLGLVLCHWLCDFVWSYMLSAVSFKGKQVLGVRFQKVVFVVCGLFMVFFSSKLVVEAVQGIVTLGS